MKYLFLSLILLLTFSCVGGGRIMTTDQYCQISVGMTTKEFVHRFGRPYCLRNLGYGEIEYEYIEKMIIGECRVLQEKHYLILFKNDRVVSTKIIYLNQPSYERNSYEMQTSYNKDETKQLIQ